jgi:hypothetical protein
MAESELIENYGYWNEHPSHPLIDWQREVTNGDTRLGYWPWVISELLEGKL